MPCVAEVVNRSLKADCTDFTPRSSPVRLETNCLSVETVVRIFLKRWSSPYLSHLHVDRDVGGL